MTNIDPDAVFRDQLLGVGQREDLQLTGAELLVTLDRVDCPVQRRDGQLLGADADQSAHDRRTL